jgi:uncharacterized phage-associated protein
MNCHDIARYFLAQVNEDEGDLISNLKLQKLVYYAQGFHLALFDTPLFNEPIEAWTHGPVVPELYHHYKQYEPGPIELPSDVNFDIYSGPKKDFLNEIYNALGQFSAWKLRNMTHAEPPWLDASATAGVITHDAMRNYFKTRIKHD